MKKPIIGIIGSTNQLLSISDRKVIYPITFIFDNIRRAILKVGGDSIVITSNQDIDYSNTKPCDVPALTEEEKEDYISKLELCDGILIPGAIGWYEYDIFACQYALKRNMPLLGICRGHQLMAAADNIEVNEYKNTLFKTGTVVNHLQPGVKEAHSVKIESNTFLKHIVKKDQLMVNSNHLYGIIKTNKAVPAARSEDNLIESIEFSDKKFAVGIQWHPDSLLDIPEQYEIMREFVRSAVR